MNSLHSFNLENRCRNGYVREVNNKRTESRPLQISDVRHTVGQFRPIDQAV